MPKEIFYCTKSVGIDNTAIYEGIMYSVSQSEANPNECVIFSINASFDTAGIVSTYQDLKRFGEFYVKKF